MLDTGDGLQPEYISNLIESLSFNKITIKEIILSHWHHDHVGGTTQILKNVEVNQLKITYIVRANGNKILTIFQDFLLLKILN